MWNKKNECTTLLFVSCCELLHHVFAFVQPLLYFKKHGKYVKQKKWVYHVAVRELLRVATSCLRICTAIYCTLWKYGIYRKNEKISVIRWGLPRVAVRELLRVAASCLRVVKPFIVIETIQKYLGKRKNKCTTLVFAASCCIMSSHLCNHLLYCIAGGSAVEVLSFFVKKDSGRAKTLSTLCRCLSSSFTVGSWVMSHIWMSLVTHMNGSCHTYEW